MRSSARRARSVERTSTRSTPCYAGAWRRRWRGAAAADPGPARGLVPGRLPSARSISLTARSHRTTRRARLRARSSESARQQDRPGRPRSGSCRVYQFDPRWCLPSLMDENPYVWLIDVDGIPADARTRRARYRRRVPAAGPHPLPAEDVDGVGDLWRSGPAEVRVTRAAISPIWPSRPPARRAGGRPAPPARTAPRGVDDRGVVPDAGELPRLVRHRRLRREPGADPGGGLLLGQAVQHPLTLRRGRQLPRPQPHQQGGHVRRRGDVRPAVGEEAAASSPGARRWRSRPPPRSGAGGPARRRCRCSAPSGAGRPRRRRAARSGPAARPAPPM